MHVMFVDDQATVLSGIAAGVHFRDLGVSSVRYATGTDSALEMLRQAPVELIFCDIEMPGRDGLELISEVRRLYPNTFVVMLTSHAEFEYAQAGMRLGCFDYILQPAPYDVIEQTIQRAQQQLQERDRKDRLSEIGTRLQTSGMELLDNLTLSLMSSTEADVTEALEMLNLLGYPLRKETPVRLMLFRFSDFRNSETPLAMEKEIHRAISDGMKQSELDFSAIHISAVDHRGQFPVLLFSAEPEREAALDDEELRRLFNCVCSRLPQALIQCCAGEKVPLSQLRAERKGLREALEGRKPQGEAMLELTYEGGAGGARAEQISGSGARWRSLLASGQYKILMNEVEACLRRIEAQPAGRPKAYCDLHQRLTHMFFNYFYENGADVQNLFRSHYSYNEYMSSFSDPEALRTAVTYMLRQAEELEQGKLPASDIEKAKTFILENLSDPITVKDVADHVCMSPEYFTKLFKRETGQNIKEFITLTKLAAAKDMLEHSGIPVGMVALELGYTNFSHFSQVFKKYEDMSPSEYRSKMTGE